MYALKEKLKMLREKLRGGIRRYSAKLDLNIQNIVE